ncbi:hypothetical protein BGZ58_004700, partial [Dissophora ornata]
MDRNRNRDRRNRTSTEEQKRHSKLFLIPAVAATALLAIVSTSSFLVVEASSTPNVEARALHASSLSDLEMIASWEPSDLDRFNPQTGSLLSPFMIPRVSGTANNTRVQEFILDYFSKLNTTSLAGTVTDILDGGYDDGNNDDEHNRPVEAQKNKKNKKKRQEWKKRDQLFRRGPNTPGSGWHVEIDRFESLTPYGLKTFTNLIFTKNPHAENRLVFAAHYDSKYFPPVHQKPVEATWDGGEDTLPFIGATDSAVPCAVLLDLATSLDRALDQPGRMGDNRETTLQLVFFDGEEAFKAWNATDSIYGSRHLAEEWAKRIVPRSRTATGRNGGSSSNYLDGIELFVLLDLLGAETPIVPSYFGATHWAHQHAMSIEQRLLEARLHGNQVLAKRKASLNKVAVEEALDPEDEDEINDDDDDEMAQEAEAVLQARGFLTANAPWGGVDDDHRPFLEKGVPILHIIPTPFPYVWHTLD